MLLKKHTLTHTFFLPAWHGITLGKPNIKVETVNKETHNLDEEAADTTSQMVEAMYSVSRHLYDSLEGSGEELMGHVEPTHTKCQDPKTHHILHTT